MKRVNDHLCKTLIAAAAALLMAMQASARELNYTFVEAGYSQAEIDGEDFTGVDLEINWALNDELYFVGQTATLDGDGSDVDDIELDAWFLGAGTRFTLTENLDLNTEAGYIERDEFDDGDADSENGYGINVALRGIANRLEYDAELSLASIDESNETSLTGTVRYYLLEAIALGAGYEWHDSDRDVFRIDLRVKF